MHLPYCSFEAGPTQRKKMVQKGKGEVGGITSISSSSQRAYKVFKLGREQSGTLGLPQAATKL